MSMIEVVPEKRRQLYSSIEVIIRMSSARLRLPEHEQGRRRSHTDSDIATSSRAREHRNTAHCCCDNRHCTHRANSARGKDARHAPARTGRTGRCALSRTRDEIDSAERALKTAKHAKRASFKVSSWMTDHWFHGQEKIFVKVRS